MSEPAKVFVNSVSVAGRLDELGLNETTLVEAVLYGLQYRLGATANDPKASLGMTVWGKVTRGLRDRLILEGWSAETDRGFEMTVHPGREYAISVAAGEWDTGIEGGNPSTSSEKGPVTREAVERSEQASFKGIDPQQDWPADETKPPPHHIWMLLYHADKKRQEIRIELSLPAGMNSANYVNRWHERIILAAQPFGAPPPGLQVNKPSDPSASGAGIDVPVDKKSKSA